MDSTLSSFGDKRNVHSLKDLLYITVPTFQDVNVNSEIIFETVQKKLKHSMT